MSQPNIIWQQRKGPKEVGANSIANIHDWYPNKFKGLQLVFDICQARGNLDTPEVKGAVGISSTEGLATYQPAIDAIIQAIDSKQRILIALDYDCDGQTAGACMVKVLRACGADVTWVVPNRLVHGYGLNVELITNAVPPGALIVSVDNGIANVAETKFLKELGYQVVITDHHIPDTEQLPEADALVDPKVNLQPEDPEYMVPGVYVAAKTALAVARKYVDSGTWGILHAYCNCLVGLGIVSDVIELHPEIRKQLLVSLADLNSCRFTGIAALLDMARARADRPINSTFIAFYVAPKLNAAGRMGCAQDGVDLLLFEDISDKGYAEAAIMANKLKNLNADRKVIEGVIYEEALKQVPVLLEQYPNSLVLYDPNWHLGVLGIIAARVAEQYHRPTIVLSGAGEAIEGSGRSVDNLDLYGCLSNCQDVITGFGGHLVAAGVSLLSANLDTFRKRFEEEVSKAGIPTEITIEYDAEATVSDITDVRFHMFLDTIEPCGNLNPEVVIRLNFLKVLESSTRGENLSIVLKDNSDRVFIGSKFKAPDAWKNLDGKYVDVLVSLQPSYYTGSTNMEYRLVDIKVRG